MSSVKRVQRYVPKTQNRKLRKTGMISVGSNTYIEYLRNFDASDVSFVLTHVTSNGP